MTADELVADNLRLAAHFARPFVGRWPTMVTEIMSAARYGLFLAARAYDPARGKFSTLAGLRIRTEINRAIDRERRTLRRFRQVRPVAGPDGEAFDVLSVTADHREWSPDAAAATADDVRRVLELLHTLPADRRRLVERYAAGTGG